MTELHTDRSLLGAHMEAELTSQPEIWARAAEQARSEAQALLPADGQKIAVIGCGTSWFMAQSYAFLRESAGRGVTDTFAASEAFVDRGYDAVVAITRSGTTTEVLEILQRLQGSVPTVALVGDTGSPVADIAGSVIGLPYADEQSVVQTRFATSALVYLQTALGISVDSAISDAGAAVLEPIAPELMAAEQFTFLGRGWTVGLAHEAALKMREASQSWTESYPAMEYRHGPIAIAAPNRVTWLFGEEPHGLASDVANTGGLYIHRDAAPLAELVRAQKVALERARVLGLNPDQPRNLSRSVILDA
ncbi:SIS domain-containing protein [Arthrobacter sp. PAMC25284]|uniref:SIS domain-containing protein n=1 Tax=Arthrobacter sp. PAMC25284 TaxID=2861279 RepID=UPI001C6394AA|nr:SIS domain-containing protein [Arthrobacter sp. PAMC25284]QYF90946.1 SIS domain-containing protein [Arthrobacter sp. PAMC25284]